MKNYLSKVAGIGLATTMTLAVQSSAQAYNFSFNSTINGNEYSGTLEFAGEGSGLSPLFTSGTKLDIFQGNADGSFYQNEGSPFIGTAPTFDVTSSTLSINSTGGMTFFSGNSLDFGDLTGSSGQELGDPSIFEASSVSFASVSATAVPFGVSTDLSILILGGMFGASRLRKTLAARK